MANYNAHDLGRLDSANANIKQAEQMWYNIQPYIRGYLDKSSAKLREASPSPEAPPSRTPAPVIEQGTLNGNNREQTLDSLTKAGSRGARIADEARINSLREARGAMPGTESGPWQSVPFERFDIHNPSNPNATAVTSRTPLDRRFEGIDPFVQGQGAGIDEAITSEQKHFDQLDPMLRGRYDSDAKRAGTYSNTDQFKKGFNDDVDAGLTGARATSQNRLKALRAARGSTSAPPATPAQLSPITNQAINSGFGSILNGALSGFGF